MDISVSQLNRRLALQLPVELPLGLVFVTGTVQTLDQTAVQTTFDLHQAAHRLRCRLTPQETARITLDEGTEVRLGGHLTFDPQRAEYYLLARDVEIIGPTAVDHDPLSLDLDGLVGDDAAFAAALVAIKRRATTAQQTSQTLPDWVQKIAPPELQDTAVPPTPEPPDPAPTAVAHRTTPLNQDLVALLSSAMESDQEIELTPDLLAQWQPQTEPTPPTAVTPAIYQPPAEPEPELPATLEITEAPPPIQPYDPVGEARPKPARPRKKAAQASQKTDWMVIILALLLVLFICILLATAVIFVIQNM